MRKELPEEKKNGKEIEKIAILLTAEGGTADRHWDSAERWVGALLWVVPVE